MADESQLLSLLIKLGVVGLDDVRAAKSLLEETGASGKEAFKGMNESLPDNLKGFGDFKKVLGETHGEAGTLREGIHGLREATHMAGPGFSEFGHLARAALNPVALGTSLAIAGMEAYFHWQEKVQEQYKEHVASLQKINDQVRDIINSGPTQNENWIAVLKTVAELKATQEGIGAELKRHAEYARQYDELMSGMEQNRLAAATQQLSLDEQRVKFLQTIGRITPEQAAERTLELEHQKKLLELQAEPKKISDEIGRKKGERDQLIADLGGPQALTPEYIGVQQARNQPYIDQKNRDEQIVDRFEAIIKDAKSQSKELTSEFLASKIDNFKDLNLAIDANNQAASLQRIYDRAKQDLPGEETAAAIATANLEAVKGGKDKVDALNAAIAELTTKLTVAQDANKSNTADENQKYAFDKLFAMLSATGLRPEDIIAQGASAQDDLKNLSRHGYSAERIQKEGEAAFQNRTAGRNYSQAAMDRLAEFKNDTAANDRLNDLLSVLGENQEKMKQIIAYHFAHATASSKEIDALLKAWTLISRQMGNAALLGNS